MTSFRIGCSALALVCCLSCLSLNYPEDPKALARESRPPNTAGGMPVVEPALSWSDLTLLAREHRKRGELDQARARLEQAAAQVRPLPPHHARRRAVFGMQARLATELAAAGELESADELADELLREAEGAPELGGAALVSLALSVADRREPDSRLELYRVALGTAQAGTTSRDRMNLAIRVAVEGYHQKDFVLARRAIDQAVLDAQHIGPSRKERIASLELYKAYVALAQMDLPAAEMSATTANRIFEEISASSSHRGTAEAILAEILAEKGDLEKALIIARGAHARIDGEEPIQDHAQRQILASLARVERSAGDVVAAQRHFEKALAIPALDLAADVDLIERLTIEVQEIDEATAFSSSPSEPE